MFEQGIILHQKKECKKCVNSKVKPFFNNRTDKIIVIKNTESFYFFACDSDKQNLALSKV